MAKFVAKDERVWKSDTVVGNSITRCMLWNDGHNVSASLVPMPKGKNLGHHRHDTWVQVFVVSGSMKVLPDNRVIESGGYYFVEEGDEHTEIALEESLVLIIRAEPTIQYPVPGGSPG